MHATAMTKILGTVTEWLAAPWGKRRPRQECSMMQTKAPAHMGCISKSP
jgi:hypothetical protein